MAPAPAAPDPAAIAEALTRRVMGQEEAVREMAVALAKQLAGLRVGNLLMIGSSGTGKTTLMRAVESYLAADPMLAGRSAVVRIHANVLGEEAERGRPGEAVLGRLLERAREQLGPSAPVEELLRRAASGLVFVDEVDKIRSHVGGQPNVAGIRAQEALLTLIENEAVPLALPAWAGGGAVTVDSSEILFVCAGAFEGLYDAVFDRVTIGKDRGALQPVTVVEGGKVQEKLMFHLRDWLRNEDLFDYGMSPQFLSRFDAVVLLQDLGQDELVRIFLETPESAFHQSRAYFESRGIHLAISPAAVRRVAAEAGRQPRLGARALKEVFRRVIRDYEFDPAKSVSGGALLIDLSEVEAALGKT
ncbi:MAG TPA: AAA family ATPase [Thermoanaerobaculia bacterium]|jgi:ATP-dependent Clp protease ATP-binding subunit ClpX|nr:AAA family ATPase [Thermoanaerobaculia bacterium]